MDSVDSNGFYWVVFDQIISPFGKKTGNPNLKSLFTRKPLDVVFLLHTIIPLYRSIKYILDRLGLI